MQSNQGPLLEIKDLVKHFPITGGLWGRVVAKVHAVDGISFQLEYGQTLGFVGESGCGKSSLGRTILRLIEPTAGHIFFQGQDITKLTQNQLRPIRRQMQMIFQDPFASLNPRMSVEEILSEPFDIHHLHQNKSERKDILEHLIKEVGLPGDALFRYPHEFSGGQRQRIGIARALALKPKLIVCDEPVSALDVSIQGQILNLMMELREKYQLSYLFIAHDLAVIEHVSQNVAVMYLGKIVEYTRAGNLYQNPKHPYTYALISSIPRIDVVKKIKRQIIQGDIPSPISPPTGCRFHTRCPYAKEICRQTEPTLENLGTEKDPHLAACHFSREIVFK